MEKILEKFNMEPVIESMTKEALSYSERYDFVRQYHDSDDEKDYSPKLTIISIGDNMASKIYVKNKITKCKEFEIETNVINFTDSEFTRKCSYIEQAQARAGFYMFNEIAKTIKELREANIPMILQLPIESEILSESEKYFLEKMIPSKLDVDGFGDKNIGKLINKKPWIMPCTVLGIMHTINNYCGTADLRDKKICVIGRSPIVGFPLIMQLIANNAQIRHINSTHSKEDLYEAIKDVDIIVLATGKHGVLTDEEIIKFNSKVFVIDVGINRDENGKLVGDLKINNPDAVSDNKKIIYTPVPGGIGKLTVLGVVINTFKLLLRNNSPAEA